MPANTFLKVFAKSPLKPIQEHITKVYEASQLLVPFFEATFEEDWTKAADIHKDIVHLEHVADGLKREIRIQLPRGLFLPVERTDLLELLIHQDHIANKSKDISGRCIGRSLVLPKEIQASFTEYLTRCIDATSKACSAINEFDELLETGFKGLEAQLVERMVEELDRLEEDTDEMQIKLRRQLLAIEKTLNPIDAMFMYQVIEWVGDLADCAERVGSRLELMLAR